MISIIIPTVNRPSSLVKLVASIETQNFPSSDYEILIVYNSAPTSDIFPSSAVTPRVRVLQAPFPGVNHARNCGIQAARGDLLFFVDDDCFLPDSEYLRRLQQVTTTHSQLVSWGGPYQLPNSATRWDRAYHRNMEQWLSANSLSADRSRVLLGGNSVYRAAVFSDSLRFTPGIRYGGSETPLNETVYSLHGAHGYFEELTLGHASHIGFKDFLRKAYMQGQGAAEKVKMSGPEAAAAARPTALLTSWPQLLYSFIFMIGYRTSIYERRHWLRSMIEEFFAFFRQRLAPPAHIWRSTSPASAIDISHPDLSKTLAAAAASSIAVTISEVPASRVRELRPLNDAIKEFIVAPSRLYPKQYWLRELPIFAQRKLRWQNVAASHRFSPHWTLPEILKQQTTTPPAPTLPALTPPGFWSRDFNAFSRSCVLRFLADPHPVFYARYRKYLSSTPRLSYLYWSLWDGLVALYKKMPAVPRQGFLRLRRESMAFFEDSFFETEQSITTLRKRSLKRLRKIALAMYWRAHAAYWNLHRLYWRASDGFWWIYSRILAPTWGFMKSLKEEPEQFRDEPWPKRWCLRAQLFARKWGWLLSRAVRSR